MEVLYVAILCAHIIHLMHCISQVLNILQVKFSVLMLELYLILDIQCDILSTPANGDISCSSGRVGVGYEGDTCSFTCNTGYELTGSTERTCQSDGSWSGSPVSCIIMECPSSSLPMNSMLAESCSSSTYQSMCELQCQEGFTGTGDPSYVCDVLSNGSSVMWMAEGDVWGCERG